jgi:Domain of unknown function (DUF4124)
MLTLKIMNGSLSKHPWNQWLVVRCRSLMSPRFLLPAFMALASMSAAAEVVYKLGDKQGHIIYSDRVIPGTRVMGKLKIPPPPDPELVAAAQAARAERIQYAHLYAEQQIRSPLCRTTN